MRPPSGKVGITSSLRGSVATVAIPKIGVGVKIYRHSEPLAKNLPEGLVYCGVNVIVISSPYVLPFRVYAHPLKRERWHA